MSKRKRDKEHSRTDGDLDFAFGVMEDDIYFGPVLDSRRGQRRKRKEKYRRRDTLLERDDSND